MTIELKGGLNIQDFVKVLVDALEDHKITADEFTSLQAHFRKLGATDAEFVSRALLETKTFSPYTQSASGLQRVLEQGNYEEFIQFTGYASR